MFIILLVLSAVGVLVTLISLIFNLEAILWIGVILIIPAYAFLIGAILGWIEFPESPNED